MTPNFEELNAWKRCATLRDAFRNLERVHDHLIDNFNLEILKPEIWTKGLKGLDRPIWTHWCMQSESVQSTSECYHNFMLNVIVEYQLWTTWKLFQVLIELFLSNFSEF